MRLSTATSAVVVAVALHASQARSAEPTAAPSAEPPPPAGATAPPANEPATKPWARAEQNRIGLDFDYWPSQVSYGFFDLDAHALAWTVHAQIRVIEGLMLTAEIPWAAYAWSVDVADRSGTGADFGNPTIGANYAKTVVAAEPGVAFFVGGTVSVPTFPTDDQLDYGDEDDFGRLMAAAGGVAVRGYFDEHRFFPTHLPIRVRGGIELRPLDFLYLRADLAPDWLIPTDDDDDFEFFMDQGNEAELRADFGLGGGLRMQEVFTFTENDLIQLGLEWFAGYEAPDAGFFGRVGWFWALDENLGFAFDSGKVMSLRVTAGGKW